MHYSDLQCFTKFKTIRHINNSYKLNHPKHFSVLQGTVAPSEGQVKSAYKPSGPSGWHVSPISITQSD